MRKALMIMGFVFIGLLAQGQKIVGTGKVDKYYDSLSNSSYPYFEGEIYLGKLSISYWSNLEGIIYPYVDVNFYGPRWYISFNPLKASEYNPKISFTYTFNL